MAKVYASCASYCPTDVYSCLFALHLRGGERLHTYATHVKIHKSCYIINHLLGYSVRPKTKLDFLGSNRSMVEFSFKKFLCFCTDISFQQGSRNLRHTPLS